MPGPSDLSNAEIDQYSIQRYIQSGLDALGWSIVVHQVTDGWPVYEQIETPGVYVSLEESEVAGIELGSHGKQRQLFVYIYGQNDAQRTRLAETLEDTIRDIVLIYDFVDGNEANPDVVDQFQTNSVRWEKIPSITTTPDKEKWRSVVTATLRRTVA